MTPTFFGRSLPFPTLSILLTQKNLSVWEVLIISHILLKGSNGTWIQVCVTLIEVVFFKANSS